MVELMSAQLHTSSVVVHGKPAEIDAISRSIENLPGAEVHGRSDQGKLVVTLEAATEQDLLERIDAINHLRGVLSVALVFHHVEEDQIQD